jgi:hypothetical protein
VDGDGGGLVGGGLVGGASVVSVMIWVLSTTPLGLIAVTVAAGSGEPCTCTCRPLRASEACAEDSVRPT